MHLKLSLLLQFLLLTFYAALSTQAAVGADSGAVNEKPKRTIAGVSVVDTPIVRAAQELVRNYSSDYLYNHVMRSWLFGVLIVSHNETLNTNVDLEVQAISSLLHDLGWLPNSPFISPDRRFEVDGAFAATDFVKGYPTGASWDENRIQLLWDSIALHSENAISKYKQSTVAVVSNGVFVDFGGLKAVESWGVTSDEYNKVVDAYPHVNLKDGVNESLIWLCQNKPASTYDTWQQAFGDAYIAKYSAVGSRIIDAVEALSS